MLLPRCHWRKFKRTKQPVNFTQGEFIMNTCNNLDEVRENIDRIDNQIVKLIAERSQYVSQASKFKKDTNDVKAPNRVEAVVQKVRSIAEENNLNPDIIEIVYRNMIDAFINMELACFNDINNEKIN
jgi:isochorismate pyruvate lyase